MQFTKYLFTLLLLCSHTVFAAHAYVQSTTGASSGSTTLTFPAITVGAGDTLCITFQDVSNALTPTGSTTQGDAVVFVKGQFGSGSDSIYALYVLSAHGGSTVVSITSADNNMYNGVVDEYSGIGAYVNVNSAAPNPGSGTNNVASGNIAFTGGQVPGMIWSVASDAGFLAAPTAGTSPISFTSRSTVNKMTTEDGTVASSGNSQGIFSTTSSSSVPVIALGFTDAATTGPTGAAYDVNHPTVSQFAAVTTSEALPGTGAGQLRYECNATAGAVTLTLPTAVNNWNTYTLVKTDSSGNACTFATTSGQTINGASTRSITTQWGGASATSDNENWLLN